MNEQKIKVVIVEPLKRPRAEEIENTLENLQKIVGGLIELIYPFEDEEIALICNDEGKINNLPLNRMLFEKETGRPLDIISGTFFVVSAKFDEEDFTSLSDEDVAKYMKRFEKIEIFTPTKNGLMLTRQ